jgi:hypothetical protein
MYNKCGSSTKSPDLFFVLYYCCADSERKIRNIYLQVNDDLIADLILLLLVDKFLP